MKSSRLSDTEAIVRKGTYPWTYKASGSKMPNMLEAPYTAEMTFNHRSGTKFSRSTGAGEGMLEAAKAEVNK